VGYAARLIWQKYELSSAQADELVRALERLWLLPFHRYEACAPHILFLFAVLPEIESGFRRDSDEQGLLFTKAYRVMAEMLLQGAAFAKHPRARVTAKARPAAAAPLLQCLVHTPGVARYRVQASHPTAIHLPPQK
jgi:hypothetical protein